MATLSQDRVKEIIDNAPEGTTPEGVVAALRSKGHELEGYPGSFSERDENKTTPLSRTAGFLDAVFGGGSVGEAIGTQVAKGTFGDTVQRFAVGRDLSEQEESQVASGPGARQIAGDVASSALGVFPATRVGNAALSGGRIASRIGKNAAVGAGIAGSEAVEQGGDVKDAATVGGVVGGALPIGGAGASALGEQLSMQPDRFVRSAMGRSKKEILNDMRGDGERSLSQFVLQNKKVGTAQTLIRNAEDDINKIGDEISNKLKSTTAKIKRDDVLDTIVSSPNLEGAAIDRTEILAAVESLAPQTKRLLQQKELTLKEANRLRQLMDTTLGSRAFLEQQIPFRRDIVRTFANELRETVKKNAPQGTRESFDELSANIRLRDALQDRLAQRAGNQVLSFGDFIGGGLGGVFSGFAGIDPLTAAAAGVAARRVLESVPFKTGAGITLDATVKTLEPVFEQVTPAARTAILNALRAASGGSDASPAQQ